MQAEAAGGFSTQLKFQNKKGGKNSESIQNLDTFLEAEALSFGFAPIYPVRPT